MKKRLLLLAALILGLSALLLSGAAMADKHAVAVENYAAIQPYCESFVITVGNNSVINDWAIGVDSDVDPAANVQIRIMPNPDCGVESIVYRYTEFGIVQTTRCGLYQDASGEVTTYFPMPLADVTVTVTMTHGGVVSYKAEASFLHCSGAISDGAQTSGDSLYAEPGSSMTVTATPLSGYYISGMTYTTFSDLSLKTIPFTTDAAGAASGSFTMPAEQVYVSVTASQFPVSYVSYDENGVSLGSQDCTSYRLLTNGDSDYYDIDGTYGGWYVVQGTVTMGSDTTIRVTGDVHLILCDGATLNAKDGIYIKKGSSLSIYGQSGGTGKLIAKPDGGPGIGGMEDTMAGSLYIHGGVIDARGGTNAAGIGGGNHQSGYENIVIYGGNVTAEGGSGAAGIGSGQQNSELGTIAIYGGTVNASSRGSGAGIGGGEDRSGGTIRIYGGTITATGGRNAAGIGGGFGGSGGNIRIDGGDITALGGLNGAGIGGGDEDHGGGNSGTVVINGGTVKATGGGNSAGIGGGDGGTVDSITINGGTVSAFSRNYKDEYLTEPGAGIGAGASRAQYGTITINGGFVTAGALSGAGIGGSAYNNGGTININGGSVVAASQDGAGIGGGGSKGGGGGGSGGNVTITGGFIYAISYAKGAGIGGGNDGHGGTVTISGGEVLALGGYLNNKSLSNVHFMRDQVPTYVKFAGIPFQYAALANEMENIVGSLVIHAIESGEFGGSAIGGGDDRDGGTVTITGGRVLCFVNLDSVSPIGRGDGGDDDGTLNLGDDIAVVAGADVESAVPVLVADRVNATRTGGYQCVAIGVCAHSGSHIIDQGHDHLVADGCIYCNLRSGETQAHNFDPETHQCVCGHREYAAAVMSTADVQAYCVDPTTGARMSYVSSGEPFDLIIPKNMDGIFLTPTAEYRESGSAAVLTHTGVTEEDDTMIYHYVMPASDVNILVGPLLESWEGLQAMIDGITGLKIITLTNDITALDTDQALVVPEGKEIIIDLNGHTLSRGAATPRADGHALTNNGTLTIRDSRGGGQLTGGNTLGSGGAIVNNHILTLTSGAITGNRATTAGAVLNNEGSRFLMTGGVLSGNASGGNGGAVVNYGSFELVAGSRITGNASGLDGGGVWNAGTLSLSGGTISGNTAGGLGGGVYAQPGGTVFLTFAPVITGNSATGHGVSNLYLAEDGGKPALVVAETLEDGLRVGLGSALAPTPEAPVALVNLVTNVSDAVSTSFTSDSAGYMIVFSDGKGKLVVAPGFGTPDYVLPAGLTTVEAEAFEGIPAMVVDIPVRCAALGDRAFRNCPNLFQIRIPAGCALGKDVFDGCPLVYVYGAPNSPAQAYCFSHGNCVFIMEDQGE